MELPLLDLLLKLFLLRNGHALMTKIVGTSGDQATLPCEASSSHTRWFWYPLNPTCADISENRVEITQNQTTLEVTPPRFNQRLLFSNQRLLLLRNLVMSDAGIYLCRLPNGSETHTQLQVDPGSAQDILLPEQDQNKKACHNNLLVSSEWLHSSLLKLSCRRCFLSGKTDSFRWMVNAEPLGNRQWAKKTNFGSTIILQPLQQMIWGRWECHSRDYPFLVSEICLTAPTGYMEVAVHEDSGSAEATSLVSLDLTGSAIARTTEATPSGPALKGFLLWIGAILLVGLVLLPAALGTAVWLWRWRGPATRKCRERKEQTDPTRQEEMMKRESLDESPASLYYAQLQHPRRKSTTLQTSESSTVYAVIV